MQAGVEAGLTRRRRVRLGTTAASEQEAIMGQLQVKIIPVTPFEQNCALIFDAETLQGAVIDPGGDVPRIMAAIAETKVTVNDIVLTHGHLDHAGGAAPLARALGVKVTGPDRRDQFLLDGLPEAGRNFGLNLAAVTPDRYLEEGDTIAIAGVEFSVLHCPGHTPGHVVFINQAQKFGIFGDVLFRNSVGRTDFAYGDTNQLITAIKTKLLPLPDDFAFICGHGVASTIGAERRSNPFIR
jgi:glyoxylase-like metal-dependent hydrolase (beta-lactamase superfamily II)